MVPVFTGLAGLIVGWFAYPPLRALFNLKGGRRS